MPISNPNIPQGNLNRLITSFLWDDVPGLNVTPGFTGKGGISIAFDGDFTSEIETMTGLVQSPEPYVMVTLTFNLLRTQPLANAYITRGQTNTVFGNGTLRPDVAGNILQPWYIQNLAWKNLRELSLAGTTPDFPAIFRGYWALNNNLWNS